MPHVGKAGVERIGVDVSLEMLRAVRSRWTEIAAGERPPRLVRGNGLRPPFREGAFDAVVVLGNVLGFAEENILPTLNALGQLLSSSGTLILEFSNGPATRSRYLNRLPPSALPRLFESPTRWLVDRVIREGFELLPERRRGPVVHRRRSIEDVESALKRGGLGVVEELAVAPALG